MSHFRHPMSVFGFILICQKSFSLVFGQRTKSMKISLIFLIRLQVLKLTDSENENLWKWKWKSGRLVTNLGSKSSQNPPILRKTLILKHLAKIMLFFHDISKNLERIWWISLSLMIHEMIWCWKLLKIHRMNLRQDRITTNRRTKGKKLKKKD